MVVYTSYHEKKITNVSMESSTYHSNSLALISFKYIHFHNAPFLNALLSDQTLKAATAKDAEKKKNDAARSTC